MRLPLDLVSGLTGSTACPHPGASNSVDSRGHGRPAWARRSSALGEGYIGVLVLPRDTMGNGRTRLDPADVRR